MTEARFSLPRETAQDNRLSWEARGVLVFLLSRPEGWELGVEFLREQGQGGRDVLRRILRELETYGFVERRKQRDKEGRIYWDFIVNERGRTETGLRQSKDVQRPRSGGAGGTTTGESVTLALTCNAMFDRDWE